MTTFKAERRKEIYEESMERWVLMMSIMRKVMKSADFGKLEKDYARAMIKEWENGSTKKLINHSIKEELDKEFG